MPSQVAAMPADQFASLWREYANEMAACLMQMGSNADSAAGRRLVSSTAAAYSAGTYCCGFHAVNEWLL